MTDEIVSKPLLRGWSHALATISAAGATVVFCVRCSDDLPRMLSMLLYGLSMCQMFGVSALYHVGSWPQRWRARLRALDHASIFGLIAGTYTPIAFNLLVSWERLAVLAAVWVQALAGMICVAAALRLPRWASTALYVGMGWVALIAAPSLNRSLPVPALGVLLGGGVAYTLGAVVYTLRRPDPWPRVFGFHEIFHVLVIVGNAAFATFIWIWVVPFPRP